MLEVLYRNREPGAEILGVEQSFDVPLIVLDTGGARPRPGRHARPDRARRRRADGSRGLKTSAWKYADVQVETSLQLSVYSYATAMNGLGDQENLRLRFDVLSKTK